ncbi:hypothetical protein [Salipiger sp. PrR007]|uniref:hypothetical protein n=1 Tax=Salipiger sp. PrR007 TaxID=2706884 RepID=UPI0013B77A58|nr:hypothetical protein [Salipiger sp. PrR007]NDW32786.1 hypothetical protein [Salipiger sp. PrR007]
MDKAAVDYSLVITKRTDLAADWPAASLVVLLSIVVHRTTTTPYAKSRIAQSAEWTQESLKIWNIAMRRLLKVFPPRRLRGHPAARRIR